MQALLAICLFGLVLYYNLKSGLLISSKSGSVALFIFSVITVLLTYYAAVCLFIPILRITKDGIVHTNWSKRTVCPWNQISNFEILFENAIPKPSVCTMNYGIVGIYLLNYFYCRLMLVIKDHKGAEHYVSCLILKKYKVRILESIQRYYH